MSGLYDRKMKLLAVGGAVKSARLVRAIDNRVALIETVLNKKHKGEVVTMEEIKIATSDVLVDWDDFAMRERSRQIEAELKRLAERLPNDGRVLLVDPKSVPYQSLVSRIAAMHKNKRLDPAVQVVRRGEQIGLRKRTAVTA